MTDHIHTARCMCGNIKLEAVGKPEYVEYCHCKWCQQSSGSSYIIWVIFKKDKVRVTSGELSYFKKSEELERGFCSQCGSTMTVKSYRHFDIALGVMDHPENFDIDQHIWTSRAFKQINIDDNLPKYPQGSPD